MRHLMIETGKTSEIIEAVQATCSLRVDHKQSIWSSPGALEAALLRELWNRKPCFNAGSDI